MRNRKTQGFTLIELLIVIAIIGILAAVLIPNLLGARRAANDRAGDAYMRNVYTAAQAYLAEHVQATTVATDCNTATGYNPYVADANVPVSAADTYTVAAWGPMTLCTVNADGSLVTGEWDGGNTGAGSVGFGTAAP